MRRILFSETRDGDDLVATGVEFEFQGQKHVVHAKAVILSAGYVALCLPCASGTHAVDRATMSPVILENSGIGQKAVLDRIGVPILLDLPGVGENLQDHTWAG